MKNLLKTLPSLMLVCAFSFSLCACNTNNDSNNGDNTLPSDNVTDDSQSEQNVPVDEPDVLVQAFGDFHTPLQAEYLLAPYTDATKYASGTKELSRPQAVTLEWEAVTDASTYYVQLATDENFTDSVIYQTEETHYDLYNLYTACEYYWRTADSVTALEDAEVNNFTTTEYAPRNIYLDGVTNVRDLGGWMTDSGVRVKQGLLYRGGRLNLSDSDTFVLELTEEGEKVFRDELGIRTEVDLRQVENNEIGSVDGGVVDGVNYVSVPLVQFGNILTGNLENMKQLFSILADENSYPLYFHCNIGTDRTGLVAFLCNALLGVNEEDLYRDYLFSNFGVVNGPRTLTSFKSMYGDAISAAEGETFAEKTANYLIDLDVITQEQIDSIRNILLEKA